MSVSAGALRRLHRVHRQLADLRDRLDQGPKKIRARLARVEHLQQTQSQAEQDARNARMTVDRKQVDLKQGENKISELKAKLNACKSNKEYQALLDQIAAAEMANSVLEDEIIEGLDGIEELDMKTREVGQQVEAVKSELDQLKEKVSAEQGGIQADVARLEKELAEAEASLPADLRADYDRVIAAKGADGMAEVDGDICTGCYLQITPNQQNDLYLGRVIFCRNCGRLVYLPEGRDRAEN